MSRCSRFLLLSMFTCFSIYIAGLLAGMLYTLYESLLRHHEQWSVLSASFPYCNVLGAADVLGMLLFFAFLISLVSETRH